MLIREPPPPQVSLTPAPPAGSRAPVLTWLPWVVAGAPNRGSGGADPGGAPGSGGHDVDTGEARPADEHLVVGRRHDAFRRRNGEADSGGERDGIRGDDGKHRPRTDRYSAYRCAATTVRGDRLLVHHRGRRRGDGRGERGTRQGAVRGHEADAIEGARVTGWSLLPTISPGTHRPCHPPARPRPGPASTWRTCRATRRPGRGPRADPRAPDGPARARGRGRTGCSCGSCSPAARSTTSCERVVGFLGGAAMVTTTDGRVLATAGIRRPSSRRTWPSTASTAPAGCSPRREPVGPRPRSTPNRSAVRIVAGHLDHGVLVGVLQPPPPDGRRRAPARAGRDGGRPGHHQGPGRLGGREQVPRRLPARRPGRTRRRARPRPSPTRLASAGTSTGRWSSSWPRPTRTTTRSTRDADEVRFLQQRFARAWAHAGGGARLRVRRSWASARRWSPCIGVPGRTPTPTPSMRIVGEYRPGRARRRRRRSAQLLDRGVAADRPRSPACPTAYDEALTAVHRRAPDARRRRP